MDILHRDDESLVGTGLKKEFQSLVPVGIGKIDRDSLVRIDIKCASGRENYVVVVAALADQQDLCCLQSRITIGVKGIRGNAGSYSPTCTVKESREIPGRLSST